MGERRSGVPDVSQTNLNYIQLTIIDHYSAIINHQFALDLKDSGCATIGWRATVLTAMIHLCFSQTATVVTTSAALQRTTWMAFPEMWGNLQAINDHSFMMVNNESTLVMNGSIVVMNGQLWGVRFPA